MFNFLLPSPADGPLAALYKKAWGKPWPSRKISITRRDLLGTGNEHGPFENEYGPFKLDEATTEWEYDCFDGIQDFERVLYTVGYGSSSLIALDEYPLLLEALGQYHKGKAFNKIVLTGQPGIGKTSFLLYVLLHRLAHKLPTAVHDGGGNFVLFSSSGAATYSVNDRQVAFPEQCWALSDGNDLNPSPCAAFRNSRVFVVYATSPRDSSMSFVDRMNMLPLVLPLPKVSEIAAVVSTVNQPEGSPESGIEDIMAVPSRRRPMAASHVLALVRSWGPCTCLIMDFVRHGTGYAERNAQDAVAASAYKLCSGEALLSPSGTEAGSSVFFLAPDPAYALPGLRTSTSGSVFIPTDALADIFSAQLRITPTEKALHLLWSLSEHTWAIKEGLAHERGEPWMHARLLGHGRRGQRVGLPIVGPNGEQRTIGPASTLAPGTLACLRRISGRPPTYWIARTSLGFAGVDAVLIDEDCVYALQAACASENRDPSAGLRALWENLDEDVRGAREWHVVVHTRVDPDLEPDRHNSVVAPVRRDLASFTLGVECKEITVWSTARLISPLLLR